MVGLACLLAAPAFADAPTAPSVPDKLPEPFAVMTFDNQSGVQGLDWMRAATPFVVGEKSEGLMRLRPVYGPLVVPRDEVGNTASEVAAFASKSGATWVYTGWIKRPDWELQLGISLWKVSGAGASRVGEVVRTGDFKNHHKFVEEAILELAGKADLRSPGDNKTAISWVPTPDFYAFTLFGRGLTELVAAGPKADKKAVEPARKNLERSTFIDPKLTEAHRVLAHLYVEQDLVKQAEARFRTIFGGRPDYAPAVLSAARLERKEGKLDVAIGLYIRALRLRPWDLESRFRLGRLYWEKGKPDDSFRELTQVVSVQPRHVRARRTLVLIHASRGNDSDLIRELEEVVKLDDKDIQVRLDLGAAYAGVGRLADAETAYRGVAELDPQNVQALKFLGDLSKRAGKSQRAIKYYGLAMKANPSDPRPYFLLGAAYVEAGDDGAAKQIYRKAQRFRRYRAEAYNNLGAIALREGRLEQSMWYLKRAVGQQPARARYRYNYALSLSKSNAVEDAFDHIRAGLKLEPNHVGLNYMRGVVLLRKGDAEAARDAFERTLQLDPSHEESKVNIALLDELKRRSEHGEVIVEGK